MSKKLKEQYKDSGVRIAKLYLKAEKEGKL